MIATILWWLGFAFAGAAIVLSLTGHGDAAFWLIVSAIASLAFSLSCEVKR